MLSTPTQKGGVASNYNSTYRLPQLLILLLQVLDFLLKSCQLLEHLCIHVVHEHSA